MIQNIFSQINQCILWYKNFWVNGEGPNLYGYATDLILNMFIVFLMLNSMHLTIDSFILAIILFITNTKNNHKVNFMVFKVIIIMKKWQPLYFPFLCQTRTSS